MTAVLVAVTRAGLADDMPGGMGVAMRHFNYSCSTLGDSARP